MLFWFLLLLAFAVCLHKGACKQRMTGRSEKGRGESRMENGKERRAEKEESHQEDILGPGTKCRTMKDVTCKQICCHCVKERQGEVGE